MYSSRWRWLFHANVPTRSPGSTPSRDSERASRSMRSATAPNGARTGPSSVSVTTSAWGWLRSMRRRKCSIVSGKSFCIRPCSMGCLPLVVIGPVNFKSRRSRRQTEARARPARASRRFPDDAASARGRTTSPRQSRPDRAAAGRRPSPRAGSRRSPNVPPGAGEAGPVDAPEVSPGPVPRSSHARRCPVGPRRGAVALPGRATPGGDRRCGARGAPAPDG